MLWMGWVGDIEDGPAPVPEMAHVEVPATIDLLHGELEGGSTLEVVIAQQLDVVCEVRGFVCFHCQRVPLPLARGERWFQVCCLN